MDMCHEMSQYTPTITHSAANTTVGACHANGASLVPSAIVRVAYFGVVRRSVVAIRRVSFVRREQRDHAVVYPSLVAKLDRERDVVGKRRKELRERAQLARVEVRTELDQNRPELVLQLTRAIEELPCEIVHVAKTPLVRDLLRQLEREEKPWRRALRPSADRLRGRDRVKGGIHLHRIEG